MDLFDIHNHCTYGIDDGIATLEECKESLKEAYQDGIRSIIGTPHFIPRQTTMTNKNEIDQRMDEVCKLAKEAGITYYKGSEIFLNDSYLEMFQEKCFYPLGDSNYVLVEFNLRYDLGDTSEVEDRLYEILVQGYCPIIAHAERYLNSKEINRVSKWIEMGCYIQINRTSLFGYHGKSAKKNAIELLNKGYVHFIASDAHQAKGSRNAVLSDAYDYITKHYSEETAKILMNKNPMHVIHGEKLEKINIKHKKKFDFFRRG